MIAASKLVAILLFAFVSLPDMALAQEQNHFTYNGFRGANLHLDGMAKLSNGLLQLTNTSKLEMGHAFFPYPMKFNRSLSFSTHFVFAMVPELSTVGGHGITFAISPSLEFEKAMPPQYLGLFNFANHNSTSNHVFAVELDTIETKEFYDINDNHIGIDVNGMISIDSAPVTYFAGEKRGNISLKLISGHPMQVWIDYDEGKRLLNVTIAPVTGTKPLQPLLSKYLDLSLVMLDSMYVGFTSSTGSMESSHYILGWSFNRSGQAESLDLSKLPPVPHKKKSINKLHLAIIFFVISAVVVLVAISGAVYTSWRKKYAEVYEDWEEKYGPQRFFYRELYKAAKGFIDEEFLGSGGFGKVYRGVLPSSNKQVAVKKISHDAKQGMKQFVAEIASMGRLKHRNLVQVLGYCRRKGELLLVYEYMPHGSLDTILFFNGTPNLNWCQRYQILRGVASALFYLHEEGDQVVLHRDVKASNIMLDKDLNGRLGDFGLAKFYDHGSNPQTTCIVGTIGYLAPEVPRTGKFTTNSDVFGFGVLMLETACGRRPVETQKSPEEIVLVDWVLHCWKSGDIFKASDPRLESNYSVQEMELVLMLGLLCSSQNPAARPSMRQVVQYLDGNGKLPELPMDGTISGLATTGLEVSGECFLSVLATNGSADSTSTTPSFLSCGP